MLGKRWQTLTEQRLETCGAFRISCWVARCISPWCSCCMTPRTHLVDQRYRLATETSAYCITLDFLNNFYSSMPQGSSSALTHWEMLNGWRDIWTIRWNTPFSDLGRNLLWRGGYIMEQERNFLSPKPSYIVENPTMCCSETPLFMLYATKGS